MFSRQVCTVCFLDRCVFSRQVCTVCSLDRCVLCVVWTGMSVVCRVPTTGINQGKNQGAHYRNKSGKKSGCPLQE